MQKLHSDVSGGEQMMCMNRFFLGLAAALMLAGCASPPQGGRPVSKVALVTSGDTYFYGATRFGQDIAVVELDGKAVAAHSDPLELQPGTHTMKMKCGENISTHSFSVQAGEIYQYMMRAMPAGKGCAAALARVRRSS